jgi:FkbM family methyltransferase
MRDAVAEILEMSGSLTVVDVGAAALDQPAPYLPLLRAGVAKLRAFEPDQRHHAKLRSIYGDALHLLPLALGDGNRRVLNLASAGSGMTSMLRPDPIRLAMFNGFEVFGTVERTVEIDTVRLDDIPGPRADMLKMDIQGAELEVMKHGERTVREAAVVQIEVSFVPLYENQPTFGEVDVWMRSQGFIPHSFAELKRWSLAPVIHGGDIRRPFNQLLEADVVYVRDVFVDPAADADLMKRIALIAHHAYRSFDLAGAIVGRLQREGVLPAQTLDRYLALTAPSPVAG